MSTNRRLAAVVAALVALGAAVPLLTGAALGTGSSTAPAAADAGPSIEVTQAGPTGQPTVTVTANGSPAANATVAVDGEYVGAGTFQADANGTVTLPEPEAIVDVEIVAIVGNDTATVNATLSPDGAESPEAEDRSFGQRLQQFLANLNDSDAPFGIGVADWVTDNNPGNAPDHAGPDGDTGPPAHAGNDSDAGTDDDESERGQPENAGQSADAGDDGASEDSADDRRDADERGTDDDRPGHGGSDNANGNGQRADD